MSPLNNWATTLRRWSPWIQIRIAILIVNSSSRNSLQEEDSPLQYHSNVSLGMLLQVLSIPATISAHPSRFRRADLQTRMPEHWCHLSIPMPRSTEIDSNSVCRVTAPEWSSQRNQNREYLAQMSKTQRIMALSQREKILRQLWVNPQRIHLSTDLLDKQSDLSNYTEAALIQLWAWQA